MPKSFVPANSVNGIMRSETAAETTVRAGSPYFSRDAPSVFFAGSGGCGGTFPRFSRSSIVPPQAAATSNTVTASGRSSRAMRFAAVV